MILDNIFEGTFVVRKNRFVWIWRINNQEIQFHIWDTGRLTNLLTKWNDILLQKMPSNGRKYNFRLIASRWLLKNYVLTNSLLHSALVREYLKNKWFEYKPEVKVGSSRLDFLVNEKIYVEIKWCTLFRKVNDDIVGLFPDAPTARGRKHLQELIQLIKSGLNSEIWFLLAQPANKFSPNCEIDKHFAQLFKTFISLGWKVRFFEIKLIYDDRNVELKLEKLTNIELLA